MEYAIDEEGNVRVANEDGGFTLLRDAEGTPYYGNVQAAAADNPSFSASPAYQYATYKLPTYGQYESALAQYSGGKVPWDYTSLFGQSGYGTTESQGGLSSREAFNLNAIWGGTQYAQGRVTDFSHIDPTQLEANQIAGQTRDQLWNQYDQLVAQGKTPPKNPDQVALDFYVKNVGPQGNTFGYGPGANTVMLSEALKSQFLNQPEVVQATGTTYQTPPERIQYAEQWGASHESGVPTWQVFEQQGYSKDWFGSLVPAILGAMVFPGLSAGLGGGFLGGAGAGALIGGTTSAISGGDFLKGALTGAVSGGASSGLSGVSADIVNATNLPKAVVDTAVNAATKAAIAGATGQDIEQAIIGSLVGSGVSAGLGSISSAPSLDAEAQPGGFYGDQPTGPTISAQTAKVLAPAITSIVMGGDVGQAVASIGSGLLANSASTIAQETGLPPTLINAAINAANSAIRSGAAGGDVETAVINSLVQSGVGAAAREALPADIARLVAPVVTTAVLGGDVGTAIARSGLAAVKQATAADAGASYLDRFVDPQADPTAVDPYLNQFADQPATQVADTGAPTTVDSGLAAIDTTAPSTQVADAPSVPVDTGLAALEPPVQVAEAPVTQPEIVAPPTVTAQAPSDLANMILKMGVGLVPKDMAYDANGDGRITSADAAMAMRGWTPSIPAPVEIAPTLPPTQVAQAPVDTGLGALASAQPALPIDIIPPSVVSDLPAAPIEVIGGPVYQGMPGSETLVPPEGTRLATADEALQLVEQGTGATTLPSGELAFIVPDTGAAPVDTTAPTDVVPDITGDALTAVPVDPYLDQFTDQPVDTSFAGVTDIPQDTGGLAAVTGGLPPDAGVNVDIPVDIPFDTTFTPPDLGVPFAPDIGAIAPDTGVPQINVTNVTPFDTSAYDAQIAALQAQLAGLTAAQQEQAMNLIAQGATTQDAIAAAQANISAQLGEQITGVQTGLQDQISGLDARQQEQLALLQQQGIDTQLAIDTVKAGLADQILGVQTGLTGQIADVQAGLQGQISGLDARQQAQLALLEQQGITTQEAIDAVKSGLADQILGVQTGLTGQISDVQAGLQGQIGDLNAAQQEQVRLLEQQGIDTQLAIDAVKAGLTEQITGVQTDLAGQITDVQTGLQGQISDLSAAQQEQVRLMEQQGITTQEAIDAVKAGLADQILGVQAGLTGQIADVQAGLQGQISDLSAAQQEQVRLLEQQGITTQEAIDAVKTGLADQILGVQADLTGQITDVQAGLTGQITGVQQDFENKFNQLSADQKLQYEMLDANQQKQAQDMAALGIDLNQAITDVQAGFAEQLTDVQQGLTGQITGLEEAFQGRFDLLTDAQKDQALALTQQGIAFGDALNAVEAGLTGQISDVQTDFQTKFQDLQQTIEGYRQQGYDQNTALQFAMDELGQRMDLSAEDMANLAGQFKQDIGGIYEELGITTSTLQDAIDSLSATQKAELDARIAQGQEINQAIDDIQQGIDTRFAETGQALTGLGGQVSTLGGQVSGLGGQVTGLGGQITGVQQSLTDYMKAQSDAQANASYKSALAALANMAKTEPNYKDPRQAYLTPTMLTTGSMEDTPFTDYASLIPQLADIDGYKAGGSIHVPGPEGRFYEKHARRGFAVGGPGTGQSDDIPTMLSDGEYVIDADTVAALGDGSSKAGAQILDKFREEIRRHKRSAPADRIPPKAKNPLAYLKSAKG